uniref:Uncharacterized protein n=1 Tax=viral metagenome TaxID=1070528 RepID=A0A6C0ENK4_9ZZZZ
MSGGVPKRILITQTQRNTPSKAEILLPKRQLYYVMEQYLAELCVIMLNDEHMPKPKRRRTTRTARSILLFRKYMNFL